LREKIEHHPDGQVHAAFMIGEELRFFFGAPAVIIFQNGLCVHRSVAIKEMTKLTQKLGGSLPQSDSPTCRVEHLSFSRKDLEEIGGNDNLSECRILVAASGLGNRAQWTMWLLAGKAENERLKIFEQQNSETSLEFWRLMGSLLDLARPSHDEPSVKLSALIPPIAGPDPINFVKKYEEQFLPLDSILEPLRQRITEELKQDLNVNASGVSCVFSVRHLERDAVHFYLTASQVKEIVRSTEDMDTLRAFSSFCYGPGDALSGWVMETGASLYLENFAESNMWSRYIAASGSRRDEREAQLNRVSRMFRVNNGDLRHAYLIPVLLRQTSNANGTPLLRADLILSITLSKQLQPEMRRHIFELVQRLGTAVGIALGAQRRYDAALARAAFAEKVQPLTAFITHNLRGRSEALSTLIQNDAAISTATETKCGHIIRDIGAVCSIVDEYHKYLSGEAPLNRVQVANFYTFVDQVWRDSWAEFLEVDPDHCENIKRRSPAPSVSAVPNSFRIHEQSFAFLLRHLMGNSIRALRGTSNGFIKLAIEYSAETEIVELQFVDNGPGMTKSTRDALLQGSQVSREPGTNTDKRSGKSGFGWYFVRLFCRAHDAAVAIPWTNDERRNECAVLVQFNLLNPDLEQ